MIQILRTLIGLAGLASTGLVLATSAPAQTQPGTWPDLTDASSYSFAGNRFDIPTGNAFSTYTNQISHTMQVSPPYAVSGVRLAYVNFFANGNGTAPAEACPGNPQTIDFATVFVGGAAGRQVTDKTAYPVTFGGSVSAVIGDCEFVWSDPLRDASGKLVTLPAGTTYYVRTNRSVAAGQNLVHGTAMAWLTAYSSPQTGDGVEFGNVAPQTARRTSGLVAAYQNGAGPGGPAMAIGTGWDGSPVFLVAGHSGTIGQSDYDFGARGVIGGIGRALDDSASGRMNFANLGVGGARAATTSSIATGQFKLRARLLRSIPNRPFNRLFVSQGENDFTTSLSLASYAALMRDYWQFWHLQCPTCPIYHMVPWRSHGGASNSTFFTTLADQSPQATAIPGQIRQQARAWMLSPGNVPSYVTPVDGNDPALGDPADPTRWKLDNTAYTLTSATAAGAGGLAGLSISGAGAPTIGDWYVFEPGTGNAEIRQAFGPVTGTGPWTVSFTATMTKAHAAGVPVLRVPTGDGTHAGTLRHKDVAQVLIGLKRSGTIH